MGNNLPSSRHFSRCQKNRLGQVNRLCCKIYQLLKSVQSALSDLKRPLNVYSPSAIIGLSLLNRTLMAHFLKQSFAQTCPKETDNGKLQQFNYSRSLIKPGFHLQQTPRPRHKKQSDYVVEQSSLPLIALFWLKIGRCRGRNWLNGNQA